MHPFAFPVAALAREPSSRPAVIGVVAEVLASGRVRVATLPAIYHALPSDAPAWALQPPGLCASRNGTGDIEDSPDTAINRFLENYFQKAALQIGAAQVALGGKPDMTGTLRAARDTLAAGWPALRSALTAPGIEQYYFDPERPDRIGFAQALPALFSKQGEFSLVSDLNAAAPVVRLRAVGPDRKPTLGWALAARIGPNGMLYLLTANHLVAPDDQGNEKEIRIYLPALQGLGLHAVRLPFVDAKLDLATLALELPPDAGRPLSRLTGAACPGTITGTAEIPVTTWSWQRASSQGRLERGDLPGQLRVENIQGAAVKGGLSGSALLSEGVMVAGIVTENNTTGPQTRRALGATLEAGLRLLPPGADLLRANPDCPPRSVEERAVQLVRQHLLGEPRILPPTPEDLRRLFGPSASAIDPTRLPSFPTLSELYDLRAGGPRRYGEWCA